MSSLLIRRARVVPVTEPAAPTGAEPFAAPATASSEPVDVLVVDGVVRAVGPALDPASEPSLAESGPVEEYAADGRWLLPGLWDQHTHLGQWTLASSRLDLHGTRTPEEALARVAAAVAVDPDQPVIGSGHSAGAWLRGVSVAELDAVSGSTPVVLINSDFHHGWLNTAALVALGLPTRNEVVRENEWYATYPRLDELAGSPSASGGSSPAAYRRMLERAAALGVVGMVDLEFGAPASDWVSRWGQGCDLLRIRWATYADGLDAVLAAGLRTGDPLVPGDDRLTMGPLKIISDGSLGTRTAWCCEPYVEAGPLNHGAPNQTGAELEQLLATATAHGLDVATHAIGDRAVWEALAAYARTGARGSIEHAQLVRRDDVRAMARLGVVASVQPAHLLDDREMTERVWPDRTERCFALRWMLDDGVMLSLGSDAPVAPLDPWLAIAAAVGRSTDGSDPWHPEQALTVQEALAASVDGQPTIGVGSRGDLVLVDRDPLAAGPAELAAISTDGGVALTVVGGRVVHRA